MHEADPSGAAPRAPRGWAPVLAGYREQNCARSTVELIIASVPFVVLWVLMWAALCTGYWIGLLLALPAAGFLVRLFMLQPYPLLPIATSASGSSGACCRRASYAPREPPVRAHGSLGRKEASAYVLSRDVYSQVGGEQKGGRGTESDVVIASLGGDAKMRRQMMSIIALIVVLIMPLGMILWWIPRCDAVGVQNAKNRTERTNPH
jgi:hypothetical protein